MTDFKQAVLTICMTAIVTGLFKMLIPDNKFKPQLSFLVACLFSICVVTAVSNANISFDNAAMQSSSVVDFSDKLSENARVAAAKGVREKTEQLLSDNGINCSKIYVIAHISGAFCISISEIELVFDKDTPMSTVESAVELVKSEVGEEITVRYNQTKT